ncbi:MAG TPA: hypothetical protein PK878_20605 [bacterium]|nr:hypothetical protein [Candidatus Omnitrophota bacterium]HOJ62683.1 hypothetical protein [bacterium]HOL96101.1 hypothetical protein [bacterium]HPO99483.1 hypothetical protein [bacterium]
MMLRRIGSLILFWLIACGFSLDPDAWLREISRMGKRTQPKVEKVTFWDFGQGKSRGWRIFLYTLPQERENRALDFRLHQKMAEFLSSMCQEVITLESIEDPVRRGLVESALVLLTEQWKLDGRIDPVSFFEAVRFLGFDLVVLMERTRYDQVFDQERKRLSIGINAAVFEMDLGEAVYRNRMTVEVPWQGEDTSYLKAEHAALLKLADAIGESLQQAAHRINKVREEELRQARTDQRRQAREQKVQIQEENQRLNALIKQANAVVRANREPKALLEALAEDAAALKPLLKRTPQDLTPEMVTQRQNLEASIQSRLREFETWKSGRMEDSMDYQQTIRSWMDLPPAESPSALSAPTSPGKELHPIPRAGQATADPRDRHWLLPESGAYPESGSQSDSDPASSGETILPGTDTSRLPASFLKLRPIRNISMP